MVAKEIKMTKTFISILTVLAGLFITCGNNKDKSQLEVKEQKIIMEEVKKNLESGLTAQN